MILHRYLSNLSPLPVGTGKGDRETEVLGGGQLVVPGWDVGNSNTDTSLTTDDTLWTLVNQHFLVLKDQNEGTLKMQSTLNIAFTVLGSCSACRFVCGFIITHMFVVLHRTTI